MSKTRHTPGPWKIYHRQVIERPLRLNERIEVMVQGGPAFALLPAGKESRIDIQQANAHLIAAAPELLDACKTVIEQASLLRQDFQWIQACKAAIAKAEGGAV